MSDPEIKAAGDTDIRQSSRALNLYARLALILVVSCLGRAQNPVLKDCRVAGFFARFSGKPNGPIPRPPHMRSNVIGN